MTKILSRLVRYAYIIAQKILFVNHIFRETRFIFVILKNYFCQPVMFDMVTQIATVTAQQQQDSAVLK